MGFFQNVLILDTEINSSSFVLKTNPLTTLMVRESEVRLLRHSKCILAKNGIVIGSTRLKGIYTFIEIPFKISTVFSKDLEIQP